MTSPDAFTGETPDAAATSPYPQRYERAEDFIDGARKSLGILARFATGCGRNGRCVRAPQRVLRHLRSLL